MHTEVMMTAAPKAEQELPKLSVNESNADHHHADMEQERTAQFEQQRQKALKVAEVPASVRAFLPQIEHAEADVTSQLNMRVLGKIMNPMHERVPEAMAKPMAYGRLNRLGWNDRIEYSTFMVDRVIASAVGNRYFEASKTA